VFGSSHRKSSGSFAKTQKAAGTLGLEIIGSERRLDEAGRMVQFGSVRCPNRHW